MQESLRRKFLPLLLTGLVVLADQITKWLVSILVKPWAVGFTIWDDFFRIIHVYNPGIAFSIGGSLSDSVRGVLFGLMPLLVIVIVLIVYFRSDEFSVLQRWCIAGIIGGGLGNLIDRFFRAEGVLDFLDVKFYGIFGLERWPTFNIADSSVVICGIILMLSLVLGIRERKDESDE